MSVKKLLFFNPLPVVKKALKERKAILKLIKKHKTPFYLYDKKALLQSIREFKSAFSAHIPSVEIYYAMKANPYELLLKDVIKSGMGIDASSGLELQQAITVGAKKVLFTGPAKTLDELKLAVRYSNKVVLNVDSFTELRKLEELMKKSKSKLRLGIRISPDPLDKWNKFGIPFKDLVSLWSRAEKNPALQLEGIQIHSSWNEDAEFYKRVIRKIAQYLKSHPRLKREVKFIDLGGGFLSYKTEGLHSWNPDVHYLSPALTLQSYAKEIGNEIKKRLSDIDCKFFFEPGRVISNNAMHIILRIEDIKNSAVITDGGTNMIGWERFEEEYCPVINLTHPSLKEEPVLIFGSLCTPHDIWGHFCYAAKMREGDILIIPYQGAYTYTYGQNFIKPFPKVYAL